MEDTLRIYTFYEKHIGEETKYYASFRDGQGVWQESEVSPEVFKEMQNLMRRERNYIRSDERHLERLELSEGMKHKRALHSETSLEEQILSKLRMEELRIGIDELPSIQRRRFLMRYEMDMTCEQIARIEGCTSRAVQHSVEAARKKIQKKLKRFEE